MYNFAAAWTEIDLFPTTQHFFLTGICDGHRISRLGDIAVIPREGVYYDR